ncbi:cystathionine beta-synthase [Nonlabens ulvanivorans]|nr:cystathionine beta-synthase [Nonlabens ulvanivorans]GAK95211.1 cystathionine beta-synthase [Nonlabens ulvanivorans]
MGYTSGAAMQAVKLLNEEGRFDENSKVVVIFPDHGSRYMSKIYNDQWMQDQGFFDSKSTATEQHIEYIK